MVTFYAVNTNNEKMAFGNTKFLYRFFTHAKHRSVIEFFLFLAKTSKSKYLVFGIRSGLSAGKFILYRIR